ncbi:hypothetical protein DH2020_041386 [Rehmannia glutinosa]|uniref:Kinesin-like protein n=1 Tax=Rehmannia glutinosa TaxID=99300 RepID=A0ABR0UR88_REHGL
MERIHVSVRPRPLSADDAKASPWRISGNSIFIHNQPSKFEFDQIFGEDCKTQDVYRARTGDIVAAAVRGFNVKETYSTSIVIPAIVSVSSLFHILKIEKKIHDMDREFLLRMSYMEIYNEEINDLLAPEHRKLQIHESIERGIFVAGLREEIVASADQVLELMEYGESHRHIGETNMNVYSSRSHTIFRMIIESREKTDDAEAEFSCDAVRVSVLNLVDLAGSERAVKTGAEGVRLKEGSHINKSLMTLGTVIKKLSEGAESQGGHVPYRDSKLTRILQPALGGNANTAIICNITLAQVNLQKLPVHLSVSLMEKQMVLDSFLYGAEKKRIHADETKSSLQFASRALRVTNCAHVNEILTDAALLKRQKKEIEELRGKLQVLSWREREMALELEEEKRAQAEREKRLQEQAKKIENLSSMVFCANREETTGVYKKAKRRDTWCPGNLARKKLKELSSVVKEHPSELKSTRADSAMGPLLPFEELFEEASTAELGKQDKDCETSALEDCILPDPHALLHVTSRRKVQPRKEVYQWRAMTWRIQAEYENLLLEFETHRTMSDIQIDYLTRKLAMADLVVDEKCRECNAQNRLELCRALERYFYEIGDSGLGAIVFQVIANSLICFGPSSCEIFIKIYTQIAILEMEKSSSQQQLDCVFDLATEQTISAQEKYEKEESNWLISLLTKPEIKLEFENSRQLIWSLSSVVDELRCFLSVMPNLIHDLQPSASQSLAQIESIVRSYRRNLMRNMKLKSLNFYVNSNAPDGNFILVILFLGKGKGKYQKGFGENKIKIKRYRVQAQECRAGRKQSLSMFVILYKLPLVTVFQFRSTRSWKLAFEMETTIASLEDQLAMANGEKDVATSG